MKTWFIFTLCFAAAIVCIAAESLLPWGANLGIPERWTPKSSGKLTIQNGVESGSVCFKVKFPPNTGFWVHPVYNLVNKLHESLKEVDSISFEVRAKQSNGRVGYHHDTFIKLGKTKIIIPNPPTDGTWQKVTIDLRKQKIEYDKTEYIQIGFNPYSPECSFELKNFCLRGTPAGKYKIDVVDAVDYSAPGAAYRKGEKVTFRMKPQFFGVPSVYKVEDWHGKEVSSGTFPDNGKGTLDLSQLPRGYYRLSLISDKQEFTGKRSFAILPDLSKHPKNPSMSYALDSCLSWHGRRNYIGDMTPQKEFNWRTPGPNFDLGIELCDRLGIGMVRERIPSPVVKQNGECDFEYYLPNAKKYAQKGIEILDMYHNMPAYTYRNSIKKFPTDALQAYNIAKKIGAGMRESGNVTYWEFDNEQDISGPFCSRKTGAGIWDYIAILKAASYAHKEADSKIRFMNGGLCWLPVRPAVGLYFKNDYQLYGDVFNVHTYDNLNGYEEMVAQIREFLAGQGVPDMPIWFTEFGTNSEGAGAVDSHLTGMKEHSEGQELVVAEFIPKANILFQQFGAERAFLFCLAPYNENNGAKPWAQTHHDFTVKPGFVALAVLNEQLGNAKLLGEMKMPEGMKAFLFQQPNGLQSIALWSVSTLEIKSTRGIESSNLFKKDAVFTANREITAVEMLGGRKILRPQKGKLKVTSTRYPLYLTGFSGLKPAKAAIPVKPFKHKDEDKFEKGIVMNLIFPEQCKVSYMGDSISIPNDHTSAQLKIWNLTDHEQKGKVLGTGCKFDGVPADEIIIAPKSLKEFTIQIDCSASADGLIQFSGIFNSKKTSRLTIPYRQLHRIADVGYQEPIRSTVDPKLWAGGFVSGSSFNEAEKAVSVDITFPRGSHPWTYPGYKLQLPHENLKGAHAVSFELKSTVDIRELLLIIPFDTPGRPDNFAEIDMEPLRKDTWKTYIMDLPSNPTPDTITAIKFGMTPRENVPSFKLLIRNVKAHYRDSKL